MSLEGRTFFKGIWRETLFCGWRSGWYRFSITHLAINGVYRPGDCSGAGGRFGEDSFCQSGFEKWVFLLILPP